MTSEPEATIVAITSDKALGEAIGRTVQRWLGAQSEFLRLTYGQCGAQLTIGLITMADLFILDLLRTYPGGLRAEGIALGERLVEKGKRILIISPLTLAKQLACRCYWDVGDPQPLGQRLQEILSDHQQSQEELARLRRYFHDLMPIPPQHE